MERKDAGEFEEINARYRVTIYPEVIQRHPGARSVTVDYVRKDDGTFVAEVHYFQMPDGKIIPNKRPDPKLLVEDGVIYHQEKFQRRLERLKAATDCQVPYCGGRLVKIEPEQRVTMKNGMEGIRFGCSKCPRVIERLP